ncbi:uncharacterized protein LOC135463658 isoform X1 [Liolophura sinensis]|uniref:uncharacterized protein LOC135463658 isoform X1 n=1 Tax=Liolophura sinensis TaxID=3198878 RepID=UPI00315910A2
MGVSLERVQLKFAAIIGELCSDPDVLSQFAVWLDLRLAEYKLRGAVSLVCSGQEPDPLWLKGLYRSKRKHAKRTLSSSPSHPRTLSPQRKVHQVVSSVNDFSPSQSHPLSPIVVKDEPTEVFPVSLHIHNNFAAESTVPRKRLSAEPAGLDSFPEEIPAHSTPPKQQRISPGEPPTNQSLMSVLGEMAEGSNDSEGSGGRFVIESVSGLDTSPLPPRNEDLNSGQSTESQFTVSPLCHNDSQSAVLDQGIQASSIAGRDNVSNSWDRNLFDADREGAEIPSRRQFGDHVTRKKTISEQNSKRRERLQNHGKMPEATIRNIVGAVASFERWLWGGQFDDMRGIHEIPPQELDAYLVEFYRTAKTPAGLEYKVTAMQSLRSNLDKYLEATKYPCSISKSPAFAQSQLEYKMWVASRKQN